MADPVQKSAAPARPAPAAPAPKAKAPPKPAAQEPAKPPSKPKGFSLGDVFDRVNDLSKKMAPKPTEEQRAALTRVRGMLEPDKLGGSDRTFNFADRDAVTRGLMRDTAGLSREVTGQLRSEGHPLQARIAERALEGRRGPLKAAARQRIYNEAPGQIAGRLEEGLRTAGVDPATAAKPDATPRNVSFAEMQRFQADTQVLEQMRRDTRERLGIDVVFPNGPSQEAIDFILSGRLGVPPGGVLKK